MKLDGNERWKSKMLLPEHHEQYNSRGEPKLSGRPAPEELTLVRDYILMPHMLTIIQRSLDDINRSGHLFKHVFAALLLVMMDRVSSDLHMLRRELKRRNIKVVDDEQVDLVVYHRIICRGYEERFGLVRDVMRAEISKRLAKYASDVVGKLKEKGPRSQGGSA